jgi:hypothetical protein
MQKGVIGVERYHQGEENANKTWGNGRNASFLWSGVEWQENGAVE